MSRMPPPAATRRQLLRSVVLAAALALGACAGREASDTIAKLTPEEIIRLSDEDICRGRFYNARNETLAAAAEARGLGDCAPNHFRCVRDGHAYESLGYFECRRRLGAPTRLSVTGQTYQPIPAPHERRCFDVFDRIVCF